MAADAWELRTARLEGAYEQVDRRLGAIEGQLSTLEQKMDMGFAQVHAEIAGVRDGLRSEITGVRDGLRSEIIGVRDGLHADLTDVRNQSHSEILGLRDKMDRQFLWLIGVLVVSGLQLVLRFTGR
jgi:hypothetical protein